MYCYFQCNFSSMAVKSRERLPHLVPRRRITVRHSKEFQLERRRKCLELFLPSLHSCCPQQEAWSSRVSGGDIEEEEPKATRLGEIVNSYVDWLIFSASGQTLETLSQIH